MLTGVDITRYRTVWFHDGDFQLQFGVLETRHKLGSRLSWASQTDAAAMARLKGGQAPEVLPDSHARNIADMFERVRYGFQ
jgi:hypothetical protein